MRVRWRGWIRNCCGRSGSERAQIDLLQIRVRAALVEARSGLVNTARGLAKALGERWEQCDTGNLNVKRLGALPVALQEGLRPLLEEVEALTDKIHACDERIEQIVRSQYPETKLLRQVSGVGPLIALTFVLTVADAARFQHSRDVGCYVGLRPKRSASGESQPQLGISKEGGRYLRKLPGARSAPHSGTARAGYGSETLGRKLPVRGGKHAKKRAIVAVARKLAILLHRLWVSGQSTSRRGIAKRNQRRKRQRPEGFWVHGQIAA